MSTTFFQESTQLSDEPEKVVREKVKKTNKQKKKTKSKSFIIPCKFKSETKICSPSLRLAEEVKKGK